MQICFTNTIGPCRRSCDCRKVRQVRRECRNVDETWNIAVFGRVPAYVQVGSQFQVLRRRIVVKDVQCHVTVLCDG